MTISASRADIASLAERIAACRICRDNPKKGPSDRLPHDPRPVAVLSDRARILIAGQAPGIRVHNTGLPFNDPSGDRLRDWLGVTRAQFYDPALFAILPMGFCFPGYDAKGGDLPPRRECAPRWRDEAMAAMPQVDLVLAIGQYAQRWHLGARRHASLTETVRGWRGYIDHSHAPMIVPLPHPSWRNTGWIKRNPWFESDLLPTLRKLVKSRVG